jgi:microcystin-dependent protein
MGGHTDYNTGDLKWSIQNIDHDFWLKCDGRSMSRIRFPTLFELIGTTYGSDDAQTFKLPDCRGRVVGCIGAGAGLTSRSAGTSLGTETHTLTIPEMPTHNHGITDPGHAHGITDPGHTHSYVNNTNDANPAVSATTTDVADNTDLNQTTGSSLTGISVNTNTTGITTVTTGNSQPHNNMQPTIFIGNVFIAYKSKIVY